MRALHVLRWPHPAVVAAAIAGSSGCLPAVPPDTLILCHNSNCAGPTDPFRDGTMPALVESLALRYRGRPTIDGIEIDINWHAQQSRCVFGHDLIRSQDGPSPIEAAGAIRDFLVSSPIPSWNGRFFFMKIDMKPEVTADNRRYDETEASLITGCALELALAVGRAGRDSGHRVQVYFYGDPDLLRRLPPDPRWPGHDPSATGVEPRFNAALGDHMPTGLRADAVSLNVNDVHDGLFTELRQSGVDVILDMFDVTSETFDTIEELEPEIVATNEAPLVRRWLDQVEQPNRNHRLF